MKKRILFFLLSLTIGLCLILGLTACGHKHAFENEVAAAGYFCSSATCDLKARYYYSCKCGEKGIETFEHGETLEHLFTNYVYNNNATCLKNGTETATCNRNCGATDTREKENTKLEHLFTNYVYNNDATCLKNGTETAICDRDNCNETNKRVKENTKSGHTYSNKGECICGEKADIILFDETKAPFFSAGKASCLVVENCPVTFATLYFWDFRAEVLVEVSMFDENGNTVIPKKQNVTSVEVNLVQGESYYIVVIPTKNTYMVAYNPLQ